jgi:hypothetical protein
MAQTKAAFLGSLSFYLCIAAPALPTFKYLAFYQSGQR